jgi:hypothetical protein
MPLFTLLYSAVRGALLKESTVATHIISRYRERKKEKEKKGKKKMKTKRKKRKMKGSITEL